MDLRGKSVLERVVERVRGSQLVDRVIVATTDNDDGVEISLLCTKMKILVYQGSEKDVLDRFYQAARKFNLDHIVRITADCPLIDPVIIDSVIASHLKNNADYSANIIKETFPDGEDVEVFTIKALASAWKSAKLKSEREHVTPYIRKNKVLFKQQSIEHSQDLSGKRWTLDELRDYQFISTIYKHLYGENGLPGMEEILIFLNNNPEIEKINQGITRNEGYLKSVMNDAIVKG